MIIKLGLNRGYMILVVEDISVSGARPGAQDYFRNYFAFLFSNYLISSS